MNRSPIFHSSEKIEDHDSNIIFISIHISLFQKSKTALARFSIKRIQLPKNKKPKKKQKISIFPKKSPHPNNHLMIPLIFRLFRPFTILPLLIFGYLSFDDELTVRLIYVLEVLFIRVLRLAVTVRLLQVMGHLLVTWVLLALIEKLIDQLRSHWSAFWLLAEVCR